MVLSHKKFRMPSDQCEREKVWTGQLDRIIKAQREIFLESIDIGKKEINLDFQSISSGKDLLAEKSAVNKLKIENRMKALCLVEQKKKIEQALSAK